MADTYEKDLGQKSSLTTSDYIRVVGSDNVSYKQPMSYFPTKAEVDALTNKSIQLTWGASVSFTCATNHRFLMIAGTNTLYTGVNYSDSLTFSKVAGADSLTFTASKNGTTITITASASTNISVLVF